MPACPFPALVGLASICCCAVFAQQPEHRAAETSDPEKITLASIESPDWRLPQTSATVARFSPAHFALLLPAIPPRTEKVNISVEFLGYTHVKPVRRQWEIPVQTPGQYRHNPPGSGSANLEEITFFSGT